MILLQVSQSCEHGRVSDAAFAPHLPRSAADKNDALVSDSVFLRKAAQITARQAKLLPCHRCYFVKAASSRRLNVAILTDR